MTATSILSWTAERRECILWAEKAMSGSFAMAESSNALISNA